MVYGWEGDAESFQYIRPNSSELNTLWFPGDASLSLQISVPRRPRMLTLIGTSNANTKYIRVRAVRIVITLVPLLLLRL